MAGGANIYLHGFVGVLAPECAVRVCVCMCVCYHIGVPAKTTCVRPQ